MNVKPILTLAAVGALSLAAVAWNGPPVPGNALAVTPAAPGEAVARGKYLVTIMGCNDCHTPWVVTAAGPEPDMTRMLSGHPQDFEITSAPRLGEGPWVAAIAGTNTAWAGPWGVSFTANLTPDAETGLGRWTPQTFKTAIRTGRHEGQGRPILPPMPWAMIRNATDRDLEAIFAYLQSIPPIHNRVPQPLEPLETAEAVAP